MLLDKAAEAGAEVIGAGICSAAYCADGRVQLGYLAHGMEAQLTADFAVFASGVNQKADRAGAVPTVTELFRQLQPGFIPPRLRKALIFELEAQAATGAEVVRPAPKIPLARRKTAAKRIMTFIPAPVCLNS